MPRIELTHDILAKEIFDQSSETQRIRREIENRIRERFADFQLRQLPITYEELQLISPYLNIVRIHPEEREFIEQSQSEANAKIKAKLRRQKNTRIFLITVSIVFASLALWASLERIRADQKSLQSKAMRISLASRYALYEGKPSVAFRLASETLNIQTDTNANSVAYDVLQELSEMPLVRDFEHPAPIVSMQFSSNGEKILIASEDGSIKLWDLTGKELLAVNHGQGVEIAKMSPNDLFIVVANPENQVIVWDSSGQELHTFSHQGKITDIQFSPDNKYLLTSSTDHQSQLWSLYNMDLIQTYTHRDTISGGRFLYQDQRDPYILTASYDSTAILWDIEGNIIRKYPNFLSQPITGLDISPTERRLLFNTTEGDFMLAPEGDTLMDGGSLYFQAVQPRNSHFGQSSNLEQLVAVSKDYMKAFVFNFDDQELDFQHAPKERVLFLGLTPQTGYLLVTSEANDATFYVPVTDSTGRLVRRFKGLFRFDCRISQGTFSPNDKHFISSSGDGSAHLFFFDTSFVAQKKRLSLDSIQLYYTSKLRRLNALEKDLYTIDE